MSKLTTIIFFASAIPFVGIHLLAERFYLYDVVRWIDIPMHFFGGVIVALALFALKENNVPVPDLSARTVVLTVIIVAFGWEIFEWFAKIMDMDAYLGDTTLDLLMGTLGGYVGYILGSRLPTL